MAQSGPGRVGSARSVLLVAHISPPSTLSAARRVAGLTKYLARLGYRVTVLTSTVSGTGPLEGAARLVRTRDLMTSRLNWRRTSFQSLAGEAEGTYEKAPSHLASVLVPDIEALSWMPFALARAPALAVGTDCLITTSPPRSSHLIGMALQRRGLRWIADFRDGWLLDDARPGYPLAAQRAVDAALERAVARSADALTTVSAPISLDLERRHGVRAATITNGFDREEVEPAADGDWQPPLAPDRHSVVHTGSLGFGGRTPAFVLAALRRLREEAPGVAGRLEVLFAGPLSADERRAIADPELDGMARAVGNMPRERAIALQRAADSLLLVADDRRTSMATGKLYEYLAARKPVLVLGEGTAAARIVSEAGCGLVASSRDSAAIASMLRAVVEGSAPRADSRVIERFSYEAVAAQMAQTIEDVCGGST